MFKTKLINKFYEALFSANFTGFATATQNAKTDYLFECDSFEAWLARLVKVYANEVGINPDIVRDAVILDTEFVKVMEDEYAELRELCDEEDWDDEE